MTNIVAVGQIALTDLNDAIMSGTPPVNPSVGTLWVHESEDPNKPHVLKRWDGVEWIPIGDLDPDLSEKITSITVTLGNMSNDNIIDYSERQVIKDKLTEIIGYIISDSATSLPTSTALDGDGKGGFYAVRKSALNAGIKINDPDYISVATQYDTLATYLNGLTPVKAWDLRESNKDSSIEVDKDVFRNKWLQYYLAVDALATKTSEQLKKNVDDLEVGGRNYISNGDFSVTLDNALWKDFYVGQIVENVDISTQDPLFQFALHVKNDSNINGGIWDSPIFVGESANILVDKEVTLQFWLRYQNIVKGTNDWNKGRFGVLVVEGETGSGSKVYSYPSIMESVTGTDMDWRKHVGTLRIELPPSAVKLTKISFRHALEGCAGEFWTTGIKLEIGNKATDWSDNPLDMQGRITDVEFKITPEGIMTIVEASETWTETINGFNLIGERVDSVESKVTPEGITTTISQSTFYDNYISEMQSKASVSDLANYTTKDELDNVVSQISDDINNAVLNIDFEPYATKQDLVETSEEITRKFSATGGMNLLKNSIGFSEYNDWAVSSTSRVVPFSNNELNVLGFGCGWQFPRMSSGQNRYLEQEVPVVSGIKYTLSWYIKKTNEDASNGIIRVQVLEKDSDTQNPEVVLDEKVYDSDYITDGYENDFFTIQPTKNIVKVRIYAEGLVNAVVTGLMFTIGDVALQWSLATGELYNTNIRLDIRGIRVSQLNSQGNEVGFTQITPDEFAGYYSPDGGSTFNKVFYLKEEETVSKKFRAIDEFTMGTIKIIKVPSQGTSSPYVGWAFVPVLEEED